MRTGAPLSGGVTDMLTVNMATGDRPASGRRLISRRQINPPVVLPDDRSSRNGPVTPVSASSDCAYSKARPAPDARPELRNPTVRPASKTPSESESSKNAATTSIMPKPALLRLFGKGGPPCQPVNRQTAAIRADRQGQMRQRGAAVGIEYQGRWPGKQDRVILYQVSRIYRHRLAMR